MTDPATWAAAGIAVVAAGISTWQAHRSNSAATRSATAVEQSAAADTEAVELARRAEQRAAAEAEARRTRWDLERIDKQRYALTNRTGELACEVTLTATDPLIASKLPAPGDVHPDEPLVFLALMHFGTVDDSIVLTWHRQGDPTPLTRTFHLTAVR